MVGGAWLVCLVLSLCYHRGHGRQVHTLKLSDLLRLSINRKEKIELSGQYLLAYGREQAGCKGVSVAAALAFLRHSGFGS